MHLRSAAIHRMREKDVKLLAELPDHLKQRPLGMKRHEATTWLAACVSDVLGKWGCR